MWLRGHQWKPRRHIPAISYHISDLIYPIRAIRSSSSQPRRTRASQRQQTHHVQAIESQFYTTCLGSPSSPSLVVASTCTTFLGGNVFCAASGMGGAHGWLSFHLQSLSFLSRLSTDDFLITFLSSWKNSLSVRFDKRCCNTNRFSSEICLIFVTFFYSWGLKTKLSVPTCTKNTEDPELTLWCHLGPIFVTWASALLRTRRVWIEETGCFVSHVFFFWKNAICPFCRKWKNI